MNKRKKSERYITFRLLSPYNYALSELTSCLCFLTVNDFQENFEVSKKDLLKTFLFSLYLLNL